MNPVVQREGQNDFVSCENSLMYENMKKAIDAEQTCPFPYAYLASCYKGKGIAAWKDYANNAKDIVEKTTQITGHNSGQDEILQILNKWLNE